MPPTAAPKQEPVTEEEQLVLRAWREFAKARDQRVALELVEREAKAERQKAAEDEAKAQRRMDQLFGRSTP